MKLSASHITASLLSAFKDSYFSEWIRPAIKTHLTGLCIYSLQHVLNPPPTDVPLERETQIKPPHEIFLLRTNSDLDFMKWCRFIFRFTISVTYYTVSSYLSAIQCVCQSRGVCKEIRGRVHVGWDCSPVRQSKTNLRSQQGLYTQSRGFNL